MDMSNATEGASFWQSHIAAWQQSGLTQKAYCEQQELRYSTFGYWVHKLRRAAEPATEKKGAGFVPVIPATVQPTGLKTRLRMLLEEATWGFQRVMRRCRQCTCVRTSERQIC